MGIEKTTLEGRAITKEKPKQKERAIGTEKTTLEERAKIKEKPIVAGKILETISFFEV